MLNNNVVNFPSEGRVFDDIDVFLNDKKNLTQKAYETDIREFFKVMRHKDIEHLTVEDIKFKRNDILKYRQLLKKSGAYKNITINRKIFGVRSLYNNLAANDYEVNPAIFDFESLSNDGETYGDISFEQALKMADAVFETEKNKKFTKHCLILFATFTSFRQEEILNANWSDFKKIEKGYSIKIVGKRDKVRETSISNKLFEKMLKMKDNGDEKGWNGDPNAVFKISKSDINRMMGNVTKALGFTEEDNIVFHSLRSVAINWILETTGDVIRAFEHSGHSNLDVFYKHYVKKGKDLNETPGILMSEEMDWTFIHELSKDQLVEFIMKGGYKSYSDIRKMYNV